MLTFQPLIRAFSFDEADETAVFDALFYLSPGEIDAIENPKRPQRDDESVVGSLYLKTRFEYRQRKLRSQIFGTLLRDLPNSGAKFSTQDVAKRFSANIAALRKSFDATQEELAEASEVSYAAIKNVENGEYNLFSYKLFDALVVGFSRLYLFRARFPFESTPKKSKPTDAHPLFPGIIEEMTPDD